MIGEKYDIKIFQLCEALRQHQKGMRRMARKIKVLKENYAALEGAYKILAEKHNGASS